MSGTTWEKFEPDRNDVGRRIDRVMRKMLSGLPLGKVYAAMRKGKVRVNGKRRTAGYRIRESDVIEISGTLLQEAGASAARKTAAGTTPAAESREGGSGKRTKHPAGDRPGIVAETEGIVAFNKPKGMLTHGTESLESFALEYLQGRYSSGLSFRPGPLHRLDRNTSGIVLFPRLLEAAERYSQLLRERQVTKEYLALVLGHFVGKTRWRDYLYRDRSARVTYVTSHADTVHGNSYPGQGSRHRPATDTGRAGEEAITDIEAVASVSKSGEVYTLLRCLILTGRTHQIRAQAAAHGFPLAGDKKYGGTRRKGGYILHAHSISLEEYDSTLGFRELRAALPRSQQAELARLFGQSLISEL